jgi:hypothetical protein
VGGAQISVNGAAAAARDRRKKFYCFFHVLCFIGKKHDLSKKKNSKFLE